MASSKKIWAEQRYLQLRNKSEAINKKEVRKDLLRRDHRSSDFPGSEL